MVAFRIVFCTVDLRVMVGGGFALGSAESFLLLRALNGSVSIGSWGFFPAPRERRPAGDADLRATRAADTAATRSGASRFLRALDRTAPSRGLPTIVSAGFCRSLICVSSPRRSTSEISFSSVSGASRGDAPVGFAGDAVGAVGGGAAAPFCSDSDDVSARLACCTSASSGMRPKRS